MRAQPEKRQKRKTCFFFIALICPWVNCHTWNGYPEQIGKLLWLTPALPFLDLPGSHPDLSPSHSTHPIHTHTHSGTYRWASSIFDCSHHSIALSCLPCTTFWAIELTVLSPWVAVGWAVVSFQTETPDQTLMERTKINYASVCFMILDRITDGFTTAFPPFFYF